MSNKHAKQQNEVELFNCKKHSRYFLMAWVMLSLALVGLIYFIQIWPSHLPSFLLNSNIFWLMKASGVIFGAFMLFSTLIFYRESKESIVLTDKNLILTSSKQTPPTIIPFHTISKFSLGSSPLEMLSRSSSLWIILKGEPEKSCLAGPLTQAQAANLEKLLEERVKQNN